MSIFDQYPEVDSNGQRFRWMGEACKEYMEQDEDVLSYALFEQVAVKFFEQRKAKKYKMDVELANTEEKTHPV